MCPTKAKYYKLLEKELIHSLHFMALIRVQFMPLHQEIQIPVSCLGEYFNHQVLSSSSQHPGYVGSSALCRRIEIHVKWEDNMALPIPWAGCYCCGPCHDSAPHHSLRRSEQPGLMAGVPSHDMYLELIIFSVPSNQIISWFYDCNGSLTSAPSRYLFSLLLLLEYKLSGRNLFYFLS